MTELDPITLGEILEQEFMIPIHINQARLAQEIMVPVGRISQIIHGKREITVDTAFRLSRFFGNTPQFWLNLQNEYNMRKYKNTWEGIASRIIPFNSHSSFQEQAIQTETRH